MRPFERMLRAGADVASARGAVIMIHGRGSSPQDILTITSHFAASDLTYLAPAAEGGVWYPQRFLVPRAANEPFLSEALGTVEQTLAYLVSAGIPQSKTVLLGFSQGACLALEFAARHPGRYGGVVGLSGGLIGADDELTGYTGDMVGTPVFLGCSDVDFHIPVERVHHTAQVFEDLGATVTKRIYPNFGHTINMDEIEHVRAILQAL
jgi:phospholipase/carboxylesterase